VPLEYLGAGNTSIEDITPLRGMSLTFLHLSATRVSNIGVLRGMPLAYLSLAKTRVTSIDALAGMPLETLLLNGTRIDDITPLRGMPLKTLDLTETLVADVSPLAGLPLRELDLFRCELVSDLQPLLQCTHLEKLRIPHHCMDIEYLRDHPSIKILDNPAGYVAFDKITKPVAQFWREWDARKHGE